MGGFLIGLSTFQGEFDFGVPQFRMLFAPVLIAFAAGVALVAARVYGGRGVALAAVGFFIVIRGGLAILVGPVLGEPTPHMPLYLAEALLVEAAALLILPRERPYAFGALAGVADRDDRLRRRVRVVSRLDADPLAARAGRGGAAAGDRGRDRVRPARRVRRKLLACAARSRLESAAARSRGPRRPDRDRRGRRLRPADLARPRRHRLGQPARGRPRAGADGRCDRAHRPAERGRGRRLAERHRLAGQGVPPRRPRGRRRRCRRLPDDRADAGPRHLEEP